MLGAMSTTGVSLTSSSSKVAIHPCCASCRRSTASKRAACTHAAVRSPMRLRKVRLPSHLLHGAKICWTRCSDSLHVQTKAAKIAAPGRRCPLKGNKPKQSGRQSTTTTPLSGAVATCRHRPPPQPKGLRPVPCRRVPRLDCADDPVYKPPARELALVRVSVYAGGGAR